MRWYSLTLVLLLSSSAAAADSRRDRGGEPLPAGAVGRLGGLQLRHTRPAFALAFAPDGKTLATASLDGNIYFWDPRTGKKLRSLSADCPAGLSGLRWSGDGKSLLAAGRDGRIYLLPVDGSRPRTLGEAGVPLLGLHVSRDGNIALTVDQQGRIHLWNTRTEKLHHELTGQPSSSSAVLTPDGKLAIFADGKGALRVIASSSGQTVRTFAVGVPPSQPRVPRRSPSEKLAVSSDGRLLAYSDWRNRIHVHALDSGEQIQVFDHKQGVIRGLAFTPDGDFLAVVGVLATRVFGVASGREMRVLEVMPLGMTTISFSPDGKKLAALADDAGLHLWDVIDGQELLAPEGHAADISALLFLPDGRRLVSFGMDGQLCLWDTTNGRMLAQSLGRQVYPHSLLAAADGHAVYLAGLNQGIETWDLGQDPTRRTSVVVIPRLRCMAASPDGKTSAVFTADRKLQLRPTGLARPRTLDAPEVDFRVLRFSPDGRLLAAGSDDDAVRLWDVTTAALVRTLREPSGNGGVGGKAPGVTWLSFAADGRSLLVSDTMLRVVETASGQERIAVRFKMASNTALGPARAYSPDGRLAAYGCGDGSILVHTLTDGREIARFQDPRGSIAALAFSPDGRRLASGGKDKAILLWKMPDDKAVEWNAAEADRLWDDLRSKQGSRVHLAMMHLSGAADRSVPSLLQRLHDHLQPVDVRRLARLIADLDADAFAQREKASGDLAELGELAADPLRKALEGEPSVEQRRRIRALLDRLPKNGLSSPRLRCLRAIEVLERIGTPLVRRSLVELSARDIDPTLREEIRASLRRLDQRR